MQAAPTAEEAPPAIGHASNGEPAMPAAGDLTVALARAAQVSPALRGAAVGSLSRSVGNAAIARAATRRVARYEAGEHSQFGGAGKTLKVGTTDITEGELQAMGDFYKDPEAMVADAKANPKAFENLRNKIREDEKLRVQGKKGLEEKEWIDATAHRPKDETYLGLAGKNISHFAPGKGPVSNKSTWETLHKRALEAAHTAKAVTDEAAMLNAFAAHFLTDAFSAGHLVPKPEMMEQAGKNFDAMPTTGILAKENDFSKALGAGLMANPKVAAELKKWELKVVAWGEFDKDRLSEVIYGMRSEAPDDFLSLFARVVHDRLDNAIKKGKGEGLEVTNANGDVWTLAGDETLNLSQDTQYIAGRAVAASRANLETAAKTTGSLDVPALYTNVWQFVPRPTTKAEHDAAVKALAAATSTTTKILAPGVRPGEQLLNDVVTQFTNPGDAEAVKDIVDLAAQKLDAVIDQLKAKGYARPKIVAPPPTAQERRPHPGKI
jgi:hypothetical protein